MCCGNKAHEAVFKHFWRAIDNIDKDIIGKIDSKDSRDSKDSEVSKDRTNSRDKLNAYFKNIQTPCYIIDEGALRGNCEILSALAKRTGCRVLLAQKAFSNFNFYNMMSEYICGTEASGLYEARLGYEMMPGKEVHVFSAAYRDEDFTEILKYADHIVFNSPRQLEKFGFKAKAAGKSIGLRINPECSTQEGHAIYDPCAPGSRLGTTREQWDAHMYRELTDILDGLHFHTLCEQDSDALEITLEAVFNKFGDILPKMKWLNMGGGHHITRPGYDMAGLERCILRARREFNLDVYIEPGEACALNSGYIATRVLDIIKNGDTNIAVLDVSAACHMPDVLEMPYMPYVYGAVRDEAFDFGANFVYRLAGPTCLAGDVIGDYCFDHSLTENEIVLLGDMAIYTTCKNNTFNGMPLPPIYALSETGEMRCVVSFDYNDFKMRLGR